MHGDHTLFTSADGIERLWEVATPLLERPPEPRPYARGSWGPVGIDGLVAPHRWHLPYTAADASVLQIVDTAGTKVRDSSGATLEGMDRTDSRLRVS
jgi:hypothetical protein